MPRLNKTFVNKIPAGPQDRLYSDSDLPGFCLRVKPSGVMTWVVRYRNERGRQRSLALGKYGELTPGEARKLAKDKLADVRRGEDPSADRQRYREALTVGELTELYRERHLSTKKDSTRSRANGLLRRVLLPALGRLKCESLISADVVRMHGRLAEKPVEANRAVTLLMGMLNWGRERDLIQLPEGNPCERVRKYPEHSRKRYLKPEEIRAFGRALDKIEKEGRFHPSSVRVIRLTLLTGCRIGEIQQLRWSAVDLEAGRLDLGDTKNGPRIVQLSKPAVKVLKKVPQRQRGEHVCPGLRGGPISYPKRLWEELRERTGMMDITPHDLRRTYASVARSQGESLEVAMELLGHRTADMGDRYAFLWDEAARSASERIGSALDELTRSG